MDNDAEVLKAAAETVTTIDLRYRAASFGEKVKLKPQRDKAFNAYAKARLKLLKDGVITSGDDVVEMLAIRQEIHQAALQQAFLAAVVKFVKFIAKFA